MSGFSKLMWNGLTVALAFSASPSCRKPQEAAKSDLGEAGYQLTATDWFRASRNNDVSALKKFVAGGFPTDTRDGGGDSALHAAAAAGAQGAADFLLDRGLSVDLRGAEDRTPLMAAVIGNRPPMVRWLLSQGADPRVKDKEGYMALMLAVREGKAGTVAELAPYNRDSLDPALLLAALVGQTETIDTLTNYGASVYARMEDGRTPLMIAAENGHGESVKLLLDIGASRFSTDTQGRTAADLAAAANHADIAALIARNPKPEELALESPAEVAKSMDAFVDAAVEDAPANTLPVELPSSAGAMAGSTEPAAVSKKSPSPSRPIQGEVVSASHKSDPTLENPEAKVRNNTFPMPPLVMRHYREREMPIQIRKVEGDVATLGIKGSSQHEVKVRTGEMVPESRLMVLRVQRRMENSKLNLGKPMEVSIVEVRDTATGTTREWISGVAAEAHDPVALIEDSATGQRYTATPGQRFKSADGVDFIVSDVRPNQLVIENAASGAVQTLPLRGPRG